MHDSKENVALHVMEILRLGEGRGGGQVSQRVKYLLTSVTYKTPVLKVKQYIDLKLRVGKQIEMT